MSKFSQVAHDAARESALAPIALIEGEEILDLLFAYRIGVKCKNGQWQLDQDYLARLSTLDFWRKRSMSTSKTTSTSKPMNADAMRFQHGNSSNQEVR